MGILTAPTDKYGDLYEEMSLLQKYSGSLNDDRLVEECLTELNIPKDINEIYSDFFKNGEITPFQRKKLEGYFLLININKFWDLDGKVYYFG